jgi:hypothetical protein
MAVSSAGLRSKSDCSGKAQKNCTLNYTPVLSSEREQKITNKQLSKGNFKEKINWSRVLDECLTPRQTGRLTVGRKLTSTSTLI